MTPADAADNHTPRFKFPSTSLVSVLGRHPKSQYISAMEHLFPFRGAQGPNMLLLHFSVLPHCMTVYFGKRRLAPETQSWQSTRCHFNEASWFHDNASGRAVLQDGQHCAEYLGKIGKEEKRHQLFAQFHLQRGIKRHADSKSEAVAVGIPPQITGH